MHTPQPSNLTFSDLFIEATYAFWLANLLEYILYLVALFIVMYRLRDILVKKNYR